MASSTVTHPDTTSLDNVVRDLARFKGSLARLYGSLSQPFDDASQVPAPVHSAQAALGALQRLRTSVDKQASVIDSAHASYISDREGVHPPSRTKPLIEFDDEDLHVSHDVEMEVNDSSTTANGVNGNGDVNNNSSNANANANSNETSGDVTMNETSITVENNQQKPYLYSRLEADDGVYDMASFINLSNSLKLDICNQEKLQDRPPCVLIVLPGILQAWVYLHWFPDNKVPKVVRVACYGVDEKKPSYALQSDLVTMQRVSAAINEGLNHEDMPEISSDRWWSAELALGLLGAYHDLGSTPCYITGQRLLLDQGAWIPPVWRVWSQGSWQASSKSPY